MQDLISLTILLVIWEMPRERFKRDKSKSFTNAILSMAEELPRDWEFLCRDQNYDLNLLLLLNYNLIYKLMKNIKEF